MFVSQPPAARSYSRRPLAIEPCPSTLQPPPATTRPASHPGRESLGPDAAVPLSRLTPRRIAPGHTALSACNPPLPVSLETQDDTQSPKPLLVTHTQPIHDRSHPRPVLARNLASQHNKSPPCWHHHHLAGTTAHRPPTWPMSLTMTASGLTTMGLFHCWSKSPLSAQCLKQVETVPGSLRRLGGSLREKVHGLPPSKNSPWFRRFEP